MNDKENDLFHLCLVQNYEAILELLPEIKDAQIIGRDVERYNINTIHALGVPTRENYDKHIEVVKALLSKGALLNYETDRSTTILGDAYKLYHRYQHDRIFSIEEILEHRDVSRKYITFLIDSGADIHGEYVFGSSALNYPELAHELLDKGVKPTVEEITDMLLWSDIDLDAMMKLFTRIVEKYTEYKLMYLDSINYVNYVLKSRIYISRLDVAEALFDYYENEREYLFKRDNMGHNIIDYAYRNSPRIINKIREIYRKMLISISEDETHEIYPFVLKGGIRMFNMIVNYVL